MQSNHTITWYQRKKEEAQAAKETDPQTAKDSTCLVEDYSKIPDVFCLLTEQVCF